MNVLHQFGLQPILLAAQAVNFLILLFILQKFLYKPILKVLDERKKKIAQSLKDADEIEKRLAQIEEDRQRALEKNAQEMKKLMDEAHEEAERIKEEARAQTLGEAGRILEEAKGQIEVEREKMNQEIRRELSTLVVAGLQKISGKVLTKKDQQEIINQTIKEL